uniref:Uncharacterized protein n=1 Tax=Corethron hystrix TaxID=216773 RepID=A0A6U5IDN7_9STRA|mmetsp:Transcript_33590/g.77489  ORF Transcript_33590/g.77489 Transcript_33590/m.77489 type:complete len:170 (+) Transcript_33590:343-852(+)|eukprot:CAMPEP_0113311516 /NCGR_PEP_ID=MMETSP0010_2-20120614/8723_1 /TAXON_ID=216773 ORGANISM="Corethron hystrix, Strain 308" /NCGR_SAMPLE_ID=MMETSP0010_2 /ASSEMBLY_ACC=CAM_ASM_000155 /LENGTH=169 /DNA_ID=CAMNT_0000167173 /DNA_START=334 /DNA_END=843 /DNA_ORIENTATION=+ /assembly_acc=CAM_ASM_000155
MCNTNDRRKGQQTATRTHELSEHRQITGVRTTAIPVIESNDYFGDDSSAISLLTDHSSDIGKSALQESFSVLKRTIEAFTSEKDMSRTKTHNDGEVKPRKRCRSCGSGNFPTVVSSSIENIVQPEVLVAACQAYSAAEEEISNLSKAVLELEAFYALLEENDVNLSESD